MENRSRWTRRYLNQI